VPYWERSFPLRTIFHWWFEKLPLQPVHAAAVGLSSGGVLITGASGSGKSTAALACLDSDLQFAGDDYVLVRHGPEPHVYSLYGTAKVEVENLARFPRLRAAVSNESRLDSEKALVFVSRFAPGKLIGGFPIRALLVSRITGARTRCCGAPRPRRLPGTRADDAVAPAGSEREAFRKLSALVREVPVYTLEAGTDLPQIPAEFWNSWLMRRSHERAARECDRACYNAARFLPDAIASVRAQHYEPLEILVVDDGSTDATPQTVAALGADIRYFRQENSGPAAARNRGLREARAS